MSTRPSYDLARTVVSLMAMLFDAVMTLRSVTFTQDRNSGTLSVLELVDPRLLNAQKTFDVGDYTDPGSAKTNPDAQKASPAVVVPPGPPVVSGIPYNREE